MKTATKLKIRNVSKRKRLSQNFILFFLLILISGSIQSANAFQAPARAIDPMMAAYNAAIYDSAVFKSENIRKLFPLKFDPVTKKALVVTYTSYDYTQNGMFKPPFANDMGGYNTWVTAFPEVQNICRTFAPKDIKTGLNQLLGLKPGTDKKYFVTMEITSGQIFRPTTNANPTSEYPCTIKYDDNKEPVIPNNCGEVFEKDNLDINYQMWFLNKALTTYAISSDPKIEGYPWTRLGYTYNWKPGADKYGASEYVIKQNSVVMIRDITPYEEYCSVKPATAD